VAEGVARWLELLRVEVRGGHLQVNYWPMELNGKQDYRLQTYGQAGLRSDERRGTKGRA
jgi:hypothetical protein